MTLGALFGSLLALSTAPAHAACVLRSEEVRSLARRSSDAIAQDDPGGHKKVLRELVARLPCLDGPLPASAWGRLLLDDAIVRFADGTPHQAQLATALRADPTLTPPDFLLAEGRPPPSVRPAAGTLRWATTVDGVSVSTPVELVGLHVVQATLPDGLTTWVVDGGGLPAALLAGGPPDRTPARGGARTWAAGAVTAGYRESGQADDAAVRGPGGGVSGWGDVAAGPVGGVASVSLTLGDGWGVGAAAGLAAGSAHVRAWVGGELAPFRVEDAGQRTLRLLPQPAIGLLARSPDLDAWVSVGGWPGSFTGEARWGAVVAPLGQGLGLRAGAAVSAATATFAGGDRVEQVTRFGGGLEVGVRATTAP